MRRLRRKQDGAAADTEQRALNSNRSPRCTSSWDRLVHRLRPGDDCIKDKGQDYRGTKSMTANGYTCQDWSSQSPQEHSEYTPTTHPHAGLEKNYCRNPDGDEGGPWCYVANSDTVTFDFCDIPQCSSQVTKEKNVDVSSVSQTVTPVPNIEGKTGNFYCGKPKRKQKQCVGKIVGGCEANPFSWPWQISLRIDSNDPASFTVYLGIHRENGNEASKQVRQVARIFRQPTGDIALLKLESPAIIRDEVLPVCLPTYEYLIPQGVKCFVTGWGDTHGTGNDGVLKEVGIPVIANKICNRPDYYNNKVTSNELCAGKVQGGADSCQGDSGGPLSCFSGGKYILQGVTSWGYGCAEPKKPGVYVRVSMYTDWIEETMREN
ncbi:plasminogen-like [Rhinophrynus dorsalis]